jgi:hypothetical protein
MVDFAVGGMVFSGPACINFLVGTFSKVKVMQSHYSSGQAKRVLRKLRFPHFVTTAQDGG